MTGTITVVAGTAVSLSAFEIEAIPPTLPFGLRVAATIGGALLAGGLVVAKRNHKQRSPDQTPRD